MNVGRIFSIPLNEKTAYLSGVVIGDGYISNSFKGASSPNSRNYRIHIDLLDFEFISMISKLTKEVISTRSSIRKKKVSKTGKSYWSFSVTNKSWWYFFTETLGVPSGKKSRIVVIPSIILTGSNIIKNAFMAGLFDTDGGFNGNSIGITTASRMMSEQISFLLNEFGYGHYISSWVIKKYNWRYYAVRIHRKDVDRFLNGVPLRYERKKVAIYARLFSRRYRSGLTGQ